MNSLLLFLTGVFASAAAQVLTRTGMTHAQGTLISALFSWHILFALCCYALAFVAYAFFLARVELSLAAPLFVGAVMLVIQVFAFFGGEQLDLNRALGTLMIIGGIVLLSRPIANSVA